MIEEVEKVNYLLNCIITSKVGRVKILISLMQRHVAIYYYCLKTWLFSFILLSVFNICISLSELPGNDMN